MKQGQDKKKFRDQSHDTTENEFSEFSDSQGSASQLKFRGQKKETKKKEETKSPLKRKLPDMERNVPIVLKNNNFAIRTTWTIFMLLGFIGIIAAGQFYVACLVFLINIGIFHEILSLKRNYEKEMKIPFFYLINWYFFSVALFYFYGKLFSNKLTKYVLNHRFPIVSYIVTYHQMITFMLWIAGFLIFVMSLKKGYYRYQFRLFGWTHITLVLVIGQSSVIIQNAYEGLVWFIIPCLLVITNDIFAYIFGISFGKTKLIELSPKKTLEGFIGGCFSTLIIAFFFALVLQKFDRLICPMLDIVFNPFESVVCETPEAFILYSYSTFLGTISFSAFQIHAMILSLFVSLIAPFGGFFASGFKRAIKIKVEKISLIQYQDMEGQLIEWIARYQLQYRYIDQSKGHVLLPLFTLNSSLKDAVSTQYHQLYYVVVSLRSVTNIQ